MPNGEPIQPVDRPTLVSRLEHDALERMLNERITHIAGLFETRIADLEKARDDQVAQFAEVMMRLDYLSTVAATVYPRSSRHPALDDIEKAVAESIDQDRPLTVIKDGEYAEMMKARERDRDDIADLGRRIAELKHDFTEDHDSLERHWANLDDRMEAQEKLTTVLTALVGQSNRDDPGAEYAAYRERQWREYGRRYMEDAPNRRSPPPPVGEDEDRVRRTYAAYRAYRERQWRDQGRRYTVDLDAEFKRRVMDLVNFNPPDGSNFARDWDRIHAEVYGGMNTASESD